MKQKNKFKQTEIGKIPEDWKIKKLGALGEVKTGKLDSNYAEEAGKYPFFTCAPSPLRINDFAFDCEAILLAGNNANGIFHLNYYNGKFNAYQRTYVITVKDEKRTNLGYLYYHLHLSLNMLKHFSQGTSTKFLTMRILDSLEIVLPPIEVQRKISKTLTDLDAKIELNNKMNKTLEAIGQALFKKWFVDERKEEWKIARLGDFISLDRGLSYKGAGLANDGIPMVNLGTMAPDHGFLYGGLKYYQGEFKERNLVKPGDIVIANTDITQRRDVLGSPAIVPNNLGSDKILFTHHIYAVRSNSEIPNIFIYYLLQSIEYKNRARGFATGTTVLALPEEAILDLEFAVPDNGALNKITSFLLTIQENIYSNINESQKLSKIRDALLPKLMSGEIRIK